MKMIEEKIQKSETVKEEKPIKETSEKELIKEEKFSFDTSVLKFVYMTEKAIKNIEKENKLIFIVHRRSTKSEIRKSVESSYGEKILGIQTMIDQKGRKKASVKFEKKNAAGDIAIKLGII